MWRVARESSAKVPEKLNPRVTPEFHRNGSRRSRWIDNQRKTRPAMAEILQGVARRETDSRLWTIPFPATSRMPEGTGYDNVVKKMRADVFAQHGDPSRATAWPSAGCGPQIFSSARKNLWYGSHYMIDDLWHDNFVVFGNGKNTQLVRVLELDAMDVFSGYQPVMGTKPRVSNGRTARWTA
jgi:hypothetical protein